MTHPSLAPVEVVLDGERHLLLLTHGAICLAERKLGVKIIENDEFWKGLLDPQSAGMSASLDSISTLLYAGLLHEGKPVDRDAILIGLNVHTLKDVSDAVAEAIKLHLKPVETPFDERQGELDERPTTAVVTG